MKKLMTAVAAALVSVVLARETPIYNGRLTSDLNAAGNRITNVAPPQASGDVATKAYVDSTTGGMSPGEAGTIATNTVNAKVATWAMQGSAQPVTAESDPTVPAWAKSATPPVMTESDPKFTEWAVTNTYVRSETDPTVASWAKAGQTQPITSESDPTVPAWAKEPNPPASGVTDVKVDGASVVSEGVANVSLSSKQDKLGSPEVFTVESIIPQPGNSSFVITSTHYVGAGDTLSEVMLNGTFSGQHSERGFSGWAQNLQRSSDGKFHLELMRLLNPVVVAEAVINFANGVSVTNIVDTIPSSTSTNRLVTSKGVADALAQKIGTETDPTVPSWAKQQNPPVMTESDPIALPIASSTSNRMDYLEGYVAGQRVRMSVTNYYGSSSGLLPRLRIEEWVTVTNVVDGIQTETNFWQTVWDEESKYYQYLTNTTSAVGGMTNDLWQTYYALLTERLATKAPRAWGTLTSAGAAAPAGSVWHTEPNTVFAGGTEYAHAMVGTGVIGVLTTRGSAVYTDGETGRFHFTTDDKQNYFGMNIASRYEIGCATDGITVTPVAGNNMVDLLYNVTMTGKPILYYTPSLSVGFTWEQITDSSGQSIPGATVYASWEQSPPAGSEICTINCGQGMSGFFKASVEYAATAKFETNMPADMKGGILATNVTLNLMQPIEPFITNGVIQWRTKQ